MVERFDEDFGESPGIFRFQQVHDGRPFRRARGKGRERVDGAVFRGIAGSDRHSRDHSLPQAFAEAVSLPANQGHKRDVPDRFLSHCFHYSHNGRPRRDDVVAHDYGSSHVFQRFPIGRGNVYANRLERSFLQLSGNADPEDFPGKIPDNGNVRNRYPRSFPRQNQPIGPLYRFLDNLGGDVFSERSTRNDGDFPPQVLPSHDFFDSFVIGTGIVDEEPGTGNGGIGHMFKITK